MFSRRKFILSGAGAMSGCLAPRLAFGQGQGPGRFLFVIQRGAADGLAMIAPKGDPAFLALRGVLARGFADAPTLDGFFALHPQLVQVAWLYGKGQALPVHAVATACRSRSHFDAQNVLETGGPHSHTFADGWMERLLPLLPWQPRRRIATASVSGASSSLAVASASCAQLVVSPGLQHRLLPGAAAEICQTDGPDDLARLHGEAAGRDIAQQLSEPGAPQLAVVEMGGWDTHFDQGARLDQSIAQLDGMIGAVSAGMGPLWRHTTVLVATEFGRTVTPNTTFGTEHGTAGAALLLGGSIPGGRVVADWPGLAQRALLHGSDLRPTLSLEQVIVEAAARTFALDPDLVARKLFPFTMASHRAPHGLARLATF